MPAAVSEMIRYQTPVIHMRRTATRDAELGGKAIRQGDKVVMWYVSGNRDETAIDDPETFRIDRPKVAPASLVRRRHPSLRRRPAGRAADSASCGARC